MKRKYIKSVIIVVLILAVLIFVGIIVANNFLCTDEPVDLVTELPDFDHEPEAVPEPEPEPELEPEPEPEPDLPREPITSLPSNMRIPALALDYRIESMGADHNHTMMIYPALDVISWFDRSAIPGNEGNAIFGGHNMWRGERSQIFDLDLLEVGDELEIGFEDGTSLRFLLESVFVYALKTAPAHLIMDPDGEPRLTLITCKPPFNRVTGTSDYRIVAIFREDGIFEIPDPPIEKFPLMDSN